MNEINQEKLQREYMWWVCVEQQLTTTTAAATEKDTEDGGGWRWMDDDLISRLTLRLAFLFFSSGQEHPWQEERDTENRARYQRNLLAGCNSHLVSRNNRRLLISLEQKGSYPRMSSLV